jgi:hypothetical protein
MATVEQIVNLLSHHANPKHFVVDVKAAMKDLEDPRQDFETVLSDPSVAEWHFYALEGLRSIAGKAGEKPLSRREIEIFIKSTNSVARQVGIDEFYKSFDALARSRDNVSYLADFISDLLSSRNQRDWLWLAFSAMATLLQRRPEVAGAVTQQLMAAYEEEPSRRKPQMEEIIRMMMAKWPRPPLPT